MALKPLRNVIWADPSPSPLPSLPSLIANSHSSSHLMQVFLCA